MGYLIEFNDPIMYLVDIFVVGGYDSYVEFLFKLMLLVGRGWVHSLDLPKPFCFEVNKLLGFHQVEWELFSTTWLVWDIIILEISKMFL